MIRVAFDIKSESIRTRLSAKDLTEWANLNFRIDATIKADGVPNK